MESAAHRGSAGGSSSRRDAVVVGHEHGGQLHRDAVVALAHRRERELEHQRVAHELLEIELVALDRIGVVVDGVRLVELGDTHGEVGGDLAQAGAALAFPAGVQLAPGDDAVGNSLEHEVEAHRLHDPRHRCAEVGERAFEVQRTARAGMRQEVGDVDAECTHDSACEHGNRRSLRYRRNPW